MSTISVKIKLKEIRCFIDLLIVLNEKRKAFCMGIMPEALWK